MKKLTIIIALIAGFAVQAQNKNAKANIEVDGVCNMCKVRIEKAAIKTKGIKLATWNLETKQLAVVYNEKKVDLNTLEQNIAAVGHDTKNIKATDTNYNALDACCKYRDPEVIEDHKGGKGHH